MLAGLPPLLAGGIQSERNSAQVFLHAQSQAFFVSAAVASRQCDGKHDEYGGIAPLGHVHGAVSRVPPLASHRLPAAIIAAPPWPLPALPAAPKTCTPASMPRRRTCTEESVLQIGPVPSVHTSASQHLLRCRLLCLIADHSGGSRLPQRRDKARASQRWMAR